MEAKKFNYYESELNFLEIKEDQAYKPIIKIWNGTNGNTTMYLSITMKQYNQIREILINQ